MKSSNSYDAVIVGSGAGGSAAAYQLARSGLQVLLIEKGPALPKDGSTLDINRVVHRGEFKSHEPWVDNRGRRFMPEEYFNLGGKTKWYGAALLRYAEHEFSADAAHGCLEWPIGYEAMLPHYLEAERLLGVRSIDGEADLRRIAGRLVARDPAWSHQSLPMGLSAEIRLAPAEARHFDGFASVADLKSDAETSFLSRVHHMPNLVIETGLAVVDLIGDPRNATHVSGVRLEDGTEIHGRSVILAAGALHSPRLLQRYVEMQDLAARLPAAAHIGRNLKYHLLTAVIGISNRRMTDLIRKTLIFLNARLPHSSVQPLGFDGELISTLIPRFVPRGVARALGARAYGFFLQTEDGAHPDNRVIAASAATQGLPCVDYDARRTPAAAEEHRRLVRDFSSALVRTGMLAFSQRVGLAGTAHVSGTLVAGNNPASSVVDAEGRVHGLQSLYVVDGSILPRSSRVNPSLTIYAWALRTTELLAARLKSKTLGAAAVVLMLGVLVLSLVAPRPGVAAPADGAPVRAITAISMTVGDMERSIAFYRTVLGFEVVSEQEIAGDEYEHLYGVFGARVRVVTLRLGGENLKLEQFLAPQGRTIPEDSRSNDRWFQHVAIIVRDMDRAFARLQSHHVEFASTGPQVLPQWNPNAGGIAAFYFRDPDGHSLEILHFPPGKGDPKWQTAGDALFLGIDHSAIVVADTDASLHYYRDTLGLKVAGGSENYGLEQERLNNVFGARLRITALRAERGPGVELLEYMAPRTGRPMPLDTLSNDLWNWHIDMLADVEKADTAVRQGHFSLVSPGPIHFNSGRGRSALMLRDPDGHATLLDSN